MKHSEIVKATAIIALGCLVNHANLAGAAETYNGPLPRFGPSPRVAITAEELAALKASPDFAPQFAAATNAAQPYVSHPVVLPEGYAGWAFDYACPDDGTPLRPISLAEHECPRCKKHFTGPREVIAYRSVLHHQLERAAYALGWAYGLTGDDTYAKEARRILLKLADDYHTYPARLDRWGHTGFFAPLGGRRYVQSLDEGVGAIDLAKAYDLVKSSGVWTEEERRHVENDFFRATADSLQKFTQPHNHQTWYNAGIIAIASALGDGDLVMKIVTMRRGVLYQLEHNIGSDGLWDEGTMAYHNYALQPLVQTADITRRLGMNLWQHPKLRAMITGPLHAAYPNGQFPAINDSDPGNVRQFQWAFDWLQKNFGEKIDPATLHLPSEALRDAGLAVLRLGTGTNAVCTFLDYGPHGGGHGHYDKLNLMLYANGREWILDPGRLTYSHKEYKTWVKTTAAHNTVTLDGESQSATTGQLLWLKQGDGWAACAAQSDGAYRGASLRRYLLLTPTFLVDVFDVKSDHTTQIDWFAHAISGKLVNIDEQQGGRLSPTGNHSKTQAVSPGKKEGYQHLSDGVLYEAKGSTRWDFVDGNQSLAVWLFASRPEQLFTATGIGYSIDQKVPCLIRRRQAKETRFVAVYDLSGNGSVIRELRSDGDAIEVGTVPGTWNVSFTPTDVSTRFHSR